MESIYTKFLVIWQYFAFGLAALSLIGSIVIYIVHKIRFSSLSD